MLPVMVNASGFFNQWHPADFISLGLVIATIILASYAFKTFRQTHGLVDANRKLAETTKQEFELRTRPWVGISRRQISSPYSDAGTGHAIVIIAEFAIANSGALPAKGITVELKCTPRARLPQQNDKAPLGILFPGTEKLHQREFRWPGEPPIDRVVLLQATVWYSWAGEAETHHTTEVFEWDVGKGDWVFLPGGSAD